MQFLINRSRHIISHFYSLKLFTPSHKCSLHDKNTPCFFYTIFMYICIVCARIFSQNAPYSRCGKIAAFLMWKCVFVLFEKSDRAKFSFSQWKIARFSRCTPIVICTSDISFFGCFLMKNKEAVDFHYISSVWLYYFETEPNNGE